MYSICNYKFIANDEAASESYHGLTCFNIKGLITMLKEFHCSSEQIQGIVNIQYQTKITYAIRTKFSRGRKQNNACSQEIYARCYLVITEK